MEKSLRIAASAKRRSVGTSALLILLATAIFSLTATAKKKSPEEQKAADPQANQQANQTEQRRDKDDPRARAAYLEKMRSGGKPVPRGARLRAMREQEQM